MRFGNLLVSLVMGLMACEDPTLLIGARPINDPDAREAGLDTGQGKGAQDGAEVGGDGEEVVPVDDGVPGQNAQPTTRRPDASVRNPMRDGGVSFDASFQAPTERYDAAVDEGPPFDDEASPGGEPPVGGDNGVEDPWRPPPEPRPRFAYRCRDDRECARGRGVCDRGRCVQCRSFTDCPPGSVCNSERMCMRRQ